MSLQQFFERLYFHDSVVERLEYLPQEQKLILSLDFCNYMQDGYQENEPENIPGNLTFVGVTDFNSDPDLASIEWGKNQDGQILILSVVKVPNRSTEKVEITIDVANYTTKLNTILAIDFFADRVDWTPIDSK
jgi:hypothetical protein